MRSWVRYSVSVYLGLLLAGSIASPTPAVSVGSAPEPTVRARPQPPLPHAEPSANTFSPPAACLRSEPARWRTTADADCGR